MSSPVAVMAADLLHLTGGCLALSQDQLRDLAKKSAPEIRFICTLQVMSHIVQVHLIETIADSMTIMTTQVCWEQH